MTYRDLWKELCRYDNLILAYKKARKHKTLKPYVQEFEKNLVSNLLELQVELQLKAYRPKSLETFIIRDPKTRKISKSDFRDRIVHHALCNIIEPIFEKTFLHDSYANRINKGALRAIERFEEFKGEVSKNNHQRCYVLKADIKHYFETVSHVILMQIIGKKVKDKHILWLIRIILENHKTEHEGKGMPLGNLTSQFFANVYLNELDHYIKEIMQVKYYIRYVDDFVILSNAKKQLKDYREKIEAFLISRLCLELHPEKTKMIVLHEGVGFLGLRIFKYHRLLKKSNVRKFKKKLLRLSAQYDLQEIDYDEIYDAIEGWIAYSQTANTYNFRNRFLKSIDGRFAGEISTKEYNRHLKANKIINNANKYML